MPDTRLPAASMLQQGVLLLERLVQDGRVQIRRPRSRQQIQFTQTLSSGSRFVAFVDAINELDGKACQASGEREVVR